ncbi:LOW QUALITY PROTEIN: hypothetical protein CVT25_006838 [Psilocybe cyanescens]|uniref:GH16 domain-containing protein n=1 Tax=Psilocybe cyanescens TaxID=93625 RepID=A0A409X7H2_PSICY|nr:LOW QUALITY PROTEIN: hypothetical protein CVT25_006838 [Psilocybe cyanescens]
MSRAPFGGQNPSAQNLLPTAGRPSFNAPRYQPSPSPSINQFSRQSKRNSGSTTHSNPNSHGGRSSTGHPFSLSPSPAQWGTPLLMNSSEPDDFLHNPDPRRDRKNDSVGSIFTGRGLANLGCLSFLALGCLTLLYVRLTLYYLATKNLTVTIVYSAGYPIVTHYTEKKQTTQGAFNLGGTNASGQVPELPGNYGLIDTDTPKEAYTLPSYADGEELVLVFSDEFNRDGRSFYPGDDPFWEAVDLHYWGTDDLEWYDPAQGRFTYLPIMPATTKGGNLELRMDVTPDRASNHNMLYKSGMLTKTRSKPGTNFVSLEAYLLVCSTNLFTEAQTEMKNLANVQLPGSSAIRRVFFVVLSDFTHLHVQWFMASCSIRYLHTTSSWSMGNLGRAGYGASVEGLWPYSYDTCDVGTLPNQTYPGENRPLAATIEGDPEVGGVLVSQNGLLNPILLSDTLSSHTLQGNVYGVLTLPACTCPGESHPGPIRKDGTYVGRAAPEIDALEATVTDGVGHVRDSGSIFVHKSDLGHAQRNGRLITQVNPSLRSAALLLLTFFARYHFLDRNNTAHFDDPAKTVLNSYMGGRYQQTTSGLAPTNPNCYEIPGTCFALFGFEYKPGFDDAYITWVNEVRAWTLYSAGLAPDSAVEIGRRIVPVEPMYIITNLGISEGFGIVDPNLKLPAIMKVDYIRVYQRKDSINVGCDPEGFPTAKYIETYKEAYTNPNLTVWSDYGQPWPKNKLSAEGC